MRRFIQLTMVCVAAAAVSACGEPEQIITTPDVPTAGVRFINAVPDTNIMDFRFVDIVENSTHYHITFRNNPVTTNGFTASALIQYKNTQAGSRHIRIFLDDTLSAVASVVLKDTTVTVENGHLYTALLYGNARTGGMKFLWLDENIPDPTTNVGLRTLNTTSTPYEVRTYVSTGTIPVAASYTVPAYSFSTFANTAVGQYIYNIQPVGGGALVASGLAIPGQPATIDIEGTPGTTQAGSAVTGIIFPASVAGSKAAQFAAPGLSFMWDRRPPRPSTT